MDIVNAFFTAKDARKIFFRLEGDPGGDLSIETFRWLVFFSFSSENVYVCVCEAILSWFYRKD